PAAAFAPQRWRSQAQDDRAVIVVAAFQAPLLEERADVIGLIRAAIDRCEAAGAGFLCCPEGVLGGLADYSADPSALAIDVRGGELARVLSPLASRTVTTIVGFTEIDSQGRLFNAAAVYHRGSVEGIYRKLHPAINRSIYQAGSEAPVF